MSESDTPNGKKNCCSCLVWLTSLVILITFVVVNFGKDSRHVSQKLANYWFIVSFLSTCLGIIMQLLECLCQKCCHCSDCSENGLSYIHFWATLLSDMPLIVISFIQLSRGGVCHPLAADDIVLRALDFFRLFPLLYRLKKSRHCFCFMLHLVGILSMALIILQFITCYILLPISTM